MAKVSAKNAVIIIAGNDLSKDAVSYNITDQYDTVEVTGFTEATHNFVPGLLSGDVTIDFLWNSAAGGAYTILTPLVGTVGSTISIYPEASGGKRWTGTFFLKGVTVNGSPSDSVKIGSCTWSVNSTVTPAWSTSS